MRLVEVTRHKRCPRRSPVTLQPIMASSSAGGTIYVTSSHIQDSAFFPPGAPAALPTELWKVQMAPN